MSTKKPGGGSSPGSPILNGPHEEPELHYATTPDGKLACEDRRRGRRIFAPETPQVPLGRQPQAGMFDINEVAEKSNPGTQVLAPDDRAAEHGGRVRSDLESRRRATVPNDTWTLPHALADFVPLNRSDPEVTEKLDVIAATAAAAQPVA